MDWTAPLHGADAFRHAGGDGRHRWGAECGAIVRADFSLGDARLAEELARMREEMKQKIAEKDRAVRAQFE